MAHDDRLIGAVVRDPAGTELGTVAALRVDPEGRTARWLDISLPDGALATVPVQAASSGAGGDLVLPFGAVDLRTAPRATGPVLDADLARDLLQHYGFPPESP